MIDAVIAVRARCLERRVVEGQRHCGRITEGEKAKRQKAKADVQTGGRATR